MATLPSYEAIGIKAVWLVTACRVIQGMVSMDEIVGAELYLAETIQLPARYMAVSIIGVFGALGAKFALGIVALVTSYSLNWRLAFFVVLLLLLLVL
ncbi:proline/betaine transporter [Rickettsia montanensis]|uniref:proline/betaine transporter n=1 Tax=Rickettsia montanensis TaxID=33991 RepID=UPI001E618793|nr:proline/betaine transporter [Rickettsia montanensis]